ncbi:MULTISPECIES: hypothetical protein [unclassified Bradyrhizobium]|uniref:hypothetical protein n=1 Tax=unclassified Bradyrhizobium TaxID=2631580 RepID=UPI0029167978|nr:MULTISPECIES: hypothetical protein [unclassified Bradyrhizobium]
MTFLETVIIAAAIFFGLKSIGDAMDNVAVGIEQAGISIANALELAQDGDEMVEF